MKILHLICYFNDKLDYQENRLIKLISTPHLSRYKIDAKGKQHGDAYDTRPALDWFRNEISKILKNDS